MGELREPEPVMLIVAAFSSRAHAIDWAYRRLVELYGPVLRESEPFEFSETDYYEREMGPGIRLKLLAFERLIRPEQIVEIKLQTNELEWAYTRWQRGAAGGPEHAGRLLNLDPGYLAGGKFVLATTKDRSHRLYLRRGIFAEVTLYFERGEFRPWPWTYPNYRRADYREFLKRARAEYLRLVRSGRAG